MQNLSVVFYFSQLKKMKYYLIGERLDYSYSANIHRYMGLDYELKQLDEKELAEFIKEKNFNGLNVTIPYKNRIIPFLDGISRKARLTGAVNTVAKVGGKLYGYNTDIGGMKFALDKMGVSVNKKNVLILGSGATAHTAQALCLLEGASSCNFVSRSGIINYENCYDLKETEIIINATPVGTFPNAEEKIISLSPFPRLTAVLDVVYNPKMTELLFEAERLKLAFSNGLPMLTEQALLAEDIWLNRAHTQSLSDKILKHISYETQNIYLCGMPSCGKSSIGRLLAERLGKKFFDTDKIIENKQGKTCAELISAGGEAFFRDLESKVIKEVSENSGAVVSLGGGSVTNERNVKEIRRSGIVVYIRRELSYLSTRNRPLSEKDGVEGLYIKRKSYYESAADIIVENNSDKYSCVREILKNL